MTPRVSIVVPAWVAADRLADCLGAVARCEARQDAQLVVVLNGATRKVRDVAAAAAAAAAAATQPLLLVDSPLNLGFGGGCMLGARRAPAPLTVFLNDDTEPEPTWLVRLLTTAEEHPEAGAIGSLILGPDGLVEECGGEITEDGWSRQLHAGEPGSALGTAGPSPVGYCSAAALLVRNFLVDDSVAFDPRFHPAYYEDLDLCVTLAQAGRAVLVEPRAVVRHHRSASTHLRYRDFLSRRNHGRFVAKWDWAGGGVGRAVPRPWSETGPESETGTDGADGADLVPDPLLLRRDLATARGFAADLVTTADRLEAELLAARERIHADHGELVALTERIHELQRHIDSLQPAEPPPAPPPAPAAGLLRTPLRRLAGWAVAERGTPGRR